MGYTNLVGQFVYKQPMLRSTFDALGENDAYLKDNNWQDSVRVTFFQAAAPTGWTQYTVINDRFLRVVNNAGANPGGVTGGAGSVSAGLSLAHTHTFTADPNHTHTGVVTHPSRHLFTGGLAIAGSTVSLLKSPVLFGIGDTVVQFNQNGSGATGPGNWGRGTAAGFAAAVTDNNPTSAAGGHNHTVGSSLGSINPAYLDVIIATKNTSSGYTDLTNQFNHNDKIRYEPFALVGGLYGNDLFTSNRLTPFTTNAVFFNPIAPTGWTKLSTQNDKCLRIVSGAGGGGGGTLPSSNAYSLNHTHSVSLAGSHSHTTGTHRHDVNAATGISARALIAHPSMNSAGFNGAGGDGRATDYGGATQALTVKGRSTLAGGGLTTGTMADHNHSMGGALTNVIPAYIDVIQCTKDSVGAPYAFQDLTTTIVYKKLVAKQKLDKFAQNDEYIRFHLVPSGSVMTFYQSTIPLLWTLVSAQHDRALRVVSGAGGGVGGNQLFSSGIPLSHAHSISTHNHDHTVPNHTHDVDTVSTSAGAFLSLATISSGESKYAAVHDVAGSGDGNIGGGPAPTPNTTALRQVSTAVGTSVIAQSHNHGGQSSFALTDFVFNYANVILCQKS